MIQANPPNTIFMDAIAAKERLHLRIEQANDQLLGVLAEMTESLFKTYQPEALGEEGSIVGYQAGKAVTLDDLKAKIERAEDQIDRGEFLTVDELEKEAEGWLNETIG